MGKNDRPYEFYGTKAEVRIEKEYSLHNDDSFEQHTIDFGAKIKVYIDNQYLVIQTADEGPQKTTLFPAHIVRILNVI